MGWPQRGRASRAEAPQRPCPHPHRLDRPTRPLLDGQVRLDPGAPAPRTDLQHAAELGLDEPGLNRVIRAAYRLLGLLTFFTAGPKEARAWTTHSGALAPQAAGEIHTDFEKGFIRAEVIAYDDYVVLDGELGAREAGKMRLEGKEYVVREGDVMHFRFNV